MFTGASLRIAVSKLLLAHEDSYMPVRLCVKSTGLNSAVSPRNYVLGKDGTVSGIVPGTDGIVCLLAGNTEITVAKCAEYRRTSSSCTSCPGLPGTRPRTIADIEREKMERENRKTSGRIQQKQADIAKEKKEGSLKEPSIAIHTGKTFIESMPSSNVFQSLVIEPKNTQEAAVLSDFFEGAAEDGRTPQEQAMKLITMFVRGQLGVRDPRCLAELVPKQ